MRRETTDLFEQDSKAAVHLQPTLLSIIEVPQWLARLEPKLAALDRDERAVVAERSEQLKPRSEDLPPK